MIADSASRLFDDLISRELLEEVEAGQWPATLWQAVNGMGLPDALLLDDEDNPWQQCYEILRAAGRHALPLPLAETMLLRYCLHLFNADPGARQTPATVMTMQQADGSLRISNVQYSNGRLSGEWRHVAFARFCDIALVEFPLSSGETATGLISLCSADDYDTQTDTQSGTVEIREQETISGEARDTVQLHEVKVQILHQSTHSVLLPVLAWMRAVMISGAIQEVLDISVRYAGERSQFGKAIGKFQAIQHALAQLAGEAACATMAAQAGISSAGLSGEIFAPACAKIRCGEASGKAAGIAHQVHGAIGFTREHQLHFLSRRLWSWRAEYGDERYWAQLLGKQAIAAAKSEQGLWSWLSA
jgi:acyl-CoA dehydrogenase